MLYIFWSDTRNRASLLYRCCDSTCCMYVNILIELILHIRSTESVHILNKHSVIVSHTKKYIEQNNARGGHVTHQQLIIMKSYFYLVC